MNKYTILHLSDLHFGQDHGFDQKKNGAKSLSLAESIERTLKDSGVMADHIVFTGDLFSKAQEKDKFPAQTGIDAIRELLKLEKSDLSFIPGNHDLSWDNEEYRFASYNELVTHFDNEGATEENLPQIKHLNEGSKDRPIYLALLNSCVVEGEEKAGIGNIGDRQMDKLEEKWQEIKPVNEGDFTLIAALHHHLLPIVPIEAEESGLLKTYSHTTDAVWVLQKFSEMKTSLVIHGHQHDAALISYQDRLRRKTPLTIAAAGSCGAKLRENRRERQFYVYEVTEDEIVIKHFVSDPDNENYFIPGYFFDKKSPNDRTLAVEMPLPHIVSSSFGACFEEGKAKRIKSKFIETTFESDNSDLNVIFLSVVDCGSSRQIIRNFIENKRAALNAKNGGDQYIELQGMYDLLGKWDLAVRLRFEKNISLDTFSTELVNELVLHKMMSDDELEFSDSAPINVAKEVKKFGDLLSRGYTIPNGGLSRTFFGDVDGSAYEKNRCQRGFLLMQLPADINKQRSLIQDFRDAFDQDPLFEDIVEGIYKSRNELIIETFTTCAKSLALNHLNRRVEPILTRHASKLTRPGLQKYTMFCYRYDEKELLERSAKKSVLLV
jgi:3',5'-cyclic AMP phosphodiesterase CpdA